MIDIASETWSLVRKRCDDGIRAATEVCLRSGLQPHEYDIARGEIAAFRAILALSEPINVAPIDRSKSKDPSGI